MNHHTLATRARPEDVRRAAGLFKILSHPDRLRLACALGDGRATTQKSLVEELGWPQSTTARHLAALRHAGLVVAERDGAEVQLRMGSPIGLDLMEAVCAWIHEVPSDPGEAGPPLGPDLNPAADPRPVGTTDPPRYPTGAAGGATVPDVSSGE